MARPLVDLLWRDHPAAPHRGARGPRARRSPTEVVEHAVALADRSGLASVTIRSLGEALGLSAMSVYTHVNSRDDLLVLMADHAHARMALPRLDGAGWRARVERVARANLDLFRAHPWLLEVTDARVALGPGTIAKYDHELHALDGTGLNDLEADAALTFVLDFARASAAARPAAPAPDGFAETWGQTAERLGRYLGDGFPLAQRVGRAAGESMGGPYDAGRAWEFGLARVVAGLADIVEG